MPQNWNAFRHTAVNMAYSRLKWDERRMTTRKLPRLPSIAAAHSTGQARCNHKRSRRLRARELGHQITR